MHKAIIVGEIGINHNGDYYIFKELVEKLYPFVDYLKVQFRTPRESVPVARWNDNKTWFDGTELTYIEYKERMEIPDEWLHWLNVMGYKWFPSVWDTTAMDRAQKWKPDYIKVPSAANQDLHLLHAAGTFCVNTDTGFIVSLGMSSEQELLQTKQVVANIYRHSGRVPTLMVCNSSYPTPDEELNLGRQFALYEDSFRTSFPVNVAYSSHSTSPFPVIYAMYLQMTVLNRYRTGMVEYHATLDRSMQGSDHAASLEQTAWELIYRERDRIAIAWGDGSWGMTPSEVASRAKLRGD